MRSPRFEPGSSAWQADVLDQARLRPHSDTLLLNKVINPIPTQIEEKIINTLIALRNDGITLHTGNQIGYKLAKGLISDAHPCFSGDKTMLLLYIRKEVVCPKCKCKGKVRQ